MRLRTLGATVEVRVSGGRRDVAVAEIERVWHLCMADSDGGPRAVVQVRHDDGRPAFAAIHCGRVEGADLPDLMQSLTQAVTRAAIDAQAGRALMFHAAGLQDLASGNTVALVGRGGAGKTTLVRTLGPGRGYITDETVAISDDNTVLPYPKPLSVRREQGSYRKDETDPHELGLVEASEPATLGSVVMLDRRDDHDGPAMVERVGTLDAIAALTPETSHLPELDKPLQRMASLCESVGGVRAVTYRDAEQLAPLLDEWLKVTA